MNVTAHLDPNPHCMHCTHGDDISPLWCPHCTHTGNGFKTMRSSCIHCRLLESDPFATHRKIEGI